MDNWHWYQWTAAIMLFIGTVNEAVNHGEPRKGKFNFPLKLCGVFLTCFLLYKGGFWN